MRIAYDYRDMQELIVRPAETEDDMTADVPEEMVAAYEAACTAFLNAMHDLERAIG